MLAGLTTGWSTAIATTLIGGAFGAVFGALSAHITGGDIKTGAMFGMLSGIISGNTSAIGAWLSAERSINNHPKIAKAISFIGGTVAGGYAAAGGQLFEYGQIVDWTEILVKAGLSGVLNLISLRIGILTYEFNDSIKLFIEFMTDAFTNGISLSIDSIWRLIYERHC